MMKKANIEKTLLERRIVIRILQDMKLAMVSDKDIIHLNPFMRKLAMNLMDQDSKKVRYEQLA